MYFFKITDSLFINGLNLNSTDLRVETGFVNLTNSILDNNIIRFETNEGLYRNNIFSKMLPKEKS